MIILNESMALAPHKPQYLNLKSKRRISMNIDHTNLMKRVIVSTTIVPLLLLLSSTASNAQPAITKDTVSVAAFDKESREQSRSRPAFWNLFERVDTVENDVSEIKGAIKDLRKDFMVASVIIFTFFIRSEIKDNEMKKDMKADKAEMKAEMEKNRAETKAEMAETKAEMKADKAEMKAEMAETKAEMKADKAETKAEMKIIKAEADRNFLITTSISTGALLVSIVMSLATKK